MRRLPKSGRIRTPDDFADIKKNGKRVRSGPIALASLKKESGDAGALSIQRLGIVVSRRVGNAVERNRIRRTIRELYRCNKEIFPKGDCVIIPQPGAAKLENEEIRRHVLRAIERLSLK